MFSGAQIILCTSHANIKWNNSQNLTFLLSPVRPFRLLLLQVLQTRFLTRFSTWCPETESVAAVKTRLSPLQLKCEKPSFWFQTHLRLRPPPLAQRARLCQDWKKREQWRVKITKPDSCSAGRLKAAAEQNCTRFTFISSYYNQQDSFGLLQDNGVFKTPKVINVTQTTL